MAAVQNMTAAIDFAGGAPAGGLASTGVTAVNAFFSLLAFGFALAFFIDESRSRLSEQKLRVDKWSVCRG